MKVPGRGADGESYSYEPFADAVDEYVDTLFVTAQKLGSDKFQKQLMMILGMRNLKASFSAIPSKRGEDFQLTVRSCASCGRVERAGDAKLQNCARCKMVCYCNARCQKEDWKRHKPSCKSA